MTTWTEVSQIMVSEKRITQNDEDRVTQSGDDILYIEGGSIWDDEATPTTTWSV